MDEEWLILFPVLLFCIILLGYALQGLVGPKMAWTLATVIVLVIATIAGMPPPTSKKGV